jgi:hypothetical protein
MKPLSAKKRNLSLIFLLLIFFIAVPFLLSYSAGYRLDFEDLTFVKTGGVFIHSDLSETNVFINDEFEESGGVILRNTLVKNLKSNEVYRIRVEKNGYYPWYKDLIVYPNLVTEAKILMIPMEIPFEQIDSHLFVKATSTKATSTSTKIVNTEYESIEELFVPATSTATSSLAVKFFNDKVQDILPASTTKLVETFVPDYLKNLGVENIKDKEQFKESGRMVSWIESGNIHIMWADDKQTKPYFFCDIRGCRDRILVSLDTEIKYFDFFPGRNDAFVVLTENHIFAVEADDRSKQNLQTIYEGKNPEFRLVGNTIFIKDGQELYKAEI